MADSNIVDRVTKEAEQYAGVKGTAAGLSALGFAPSVESGASFLIKAAAKPLPVASVLGAGVTGYDVGSEASRAYDKSFNEDKVQNAIAAGIGSAAQGLSFGLINGSAIEDKLSSNKHMDNLMAEVARQQSGR